MPLLETPGHSQVNLGQSLVDHCSFLLEKKLENLTVATRLENVSFHSNPKEGQCQRMFKVKVKVKSLSHA